MILYRIMTTQHLDTDTVYQLYRTSLQNARLIRSSSYLPIAT